MKKLIIAAAVIAASGITALSVGKKSDVKQVKIAKIDKIEFMAKGFSSQKSDIATAD